ncbi:BACON domain-containing protein [Arenibacter latericius]|uniref:BACON domain-containing protein n=1 Tax=Arenibacter latericius TaxID=86104 RepID=UPI000410DAB8|nr:BACON domain-containing protein [Arenibacter latericius]
MHTIYNKTKGRLGALLLISLFTIPLLFIACSDDDNEYNEEPYFIVEENPTGIEVGVNGDTKSYVVRSNRPWQIVPQGESDWVKTFPIEGKDDGIFKVIVSENDTFDPRTINIAFVVDGKEQPLLFRVDQEANVPYITLDNEEKGIAVPSAESELTIGVKANVEWTYTLENASWLTEITVSDDEIQLVALRNKGEERSAKLTVSSVQHPSLDKEIVITQSAGNIILEENFNWLTYGSTIFYTTSGEKRMDSWTSDELERGWNSTENEFSSGQKLVYARTGFVKLGKTNYGGDLISPALSNLEETSNVRVTFKAVPYQTKGGTRDANTLKIEALGAGTASVNSLIIDNWPDYDADPECTEVWQAESAKYEFIISGADASTHIKLLGGDYDLRNASPNKNRIFIDDIKVEIID